MKRIWTLDQIPVQVEEWSRGSNFEAQSLEAQTVLVHSTVLLLELGSQPEHVGQEDLGASRVMRRRLGREANGAMAAVSPM